MGPEGQQIQPGMELAPQTYQVERWMLRQFVRAVGDPNPLWQEEDTARSQYGGSVAPPTFVVTLGMEQIQQLLAMAPSGTSLHGSTELECYHPIHPGDTITKKTRVENVRERQGKMGKMSFITFEISYENQRKELVARCRQMIINY